MGVPFVVNLRRIFTTIANQPWLPCKKANFRSNIFLRKLYITKLYYNLYLIFVNYIYKSNFKYILVNLDEKIRAIWFATLLTKCSPFEGKNKGTSKRGEGEDQQLQNNLNTSGTQNQPTKLFFYLLLTWYNNLFIVYLVKYDLYWVSAC